jgi:hypothetical protein
MRTKKLIGLDLSEGSGAIPREVDVIDAAVRWPDVVIRCNRTTFLFFTGLGPETQLIQTQLLIKIVLASNDLRRS